MTLPGHHVGLFPFSEGWDYRGPALCISPLCLASFLWTFRLHAPHITSFGVLHYPLSFLYIWPIFLQSFCIKISSSYPIPE